MGASSPCIRWERPRRAKQLVSQLGSDTEEPVHVERRGRRHTLPFVRRAALGDQAGEAAGRSHDQNTRLTVAGSSQGVWRANGNEDVFAVTQHNLALAGPGCELSFHDVQLLGVAAVPVGRDLRAGGQEVLDEIVAPRSVRMACQDNQMSAEGPVRSSHRLSFLEGKEGVRFLFHAFPFFFGRPRGRKEDSSCSSDETRAAGPW